MVQRNKLRINYRNMDIRRLISIYLDLSTFVNNLGGNLNSTKHPTLFVGKLEICVFETIKQTNMS